MKVLSSTLFRAVCSVAVGILLLKYPDDALMWLTRLIGILFLLPGIYAIIVYYVTRRQDATVTDANGNVLLQAYPSFPFVGLGCIILGCTLALMPLVFVKYLMYVLAALLILGAINTLAMLFRASRYYHIGAGNYAIPSLILLTGICIFFFPVETAVSPLLVIGIAMILYGVSDCLYAVMIWRSRRKYEKEQKHQRAVADASEVAEQPVAEVRRVESEPLATERPEVKAAEVRDDSNRISFVEE